MTIELSSASLETYACEPHVQLHLSSTETVIHCARLGVVRIVDNEAANLLGSCAHFDSLRAHARNQAAPRGRLGRWFDALLGRAGARAEEIERLETRLQDLTAGGLLVRHGDVIGRLLGSGSGRIASPISSIGIVTSDRTGSLRRCVDSYAKNLRECGHEVEFVVVDDSHDASVRGRNRDILRDLAVRHDARISYAGAEEKEGYLAELVAFSGLPEDVLRFGLLPEGANGRTYGANRNALLLATAGEMLVSVDDDTICELAWHPDRKGQLRISAAADAYDWRPLPTRAEALRAVRITPIDFLAAHQELLGHGLGDAVGRYGAEGVQLDKLAPWFHRVGGDTQSNVRLTSLGLVGDCGMASPHPYLLFSGGSRARLLASKKAYRNACQSREVLLGAPDTTLVAGGPWIGLCFGLDNRELTPPFMPIGRSEDGLFMQMLLQCDPTAFGAHLPLTIVHAPVEERRFGREDISRGLTEPRICDLVAAVLPPNVGGDDTSANLRTVGEALVAVGSLPIPECHEYTRRPCWRIQQHQSRLLEQQLESYHSTPAFWARDVRERLRLIAASMVNSSFPVSSDLQSDSDPERTRVADRAYILSFGRLVYHWSEVVEAVRALRGRGRSIAVPLQ